MTDASLNSTGNTAPNLNKKLTIDLAAPGTGFMDTWRAMGPGIAAAMTGIGASHIMHAPTAGARYGYELL